MTAIPHEDAYFGPIPKRKLKFVLGGVVILIAIAFLITNGVRSAGNYYITLEELAARGDQVIGEGIRINAVVDKESVEYDSRDIRLAFDLVDENGHRQHVVYDDVMPDLFMKSESVIVEGQLNDAGTFQANMILVKCPSKYEEKVEEGEQVPDDHRVDPSTLNVEG